LFLFERKTTNAMFVLFFNTHEKKNNNKNNNKQKKRTLWNHWGTKISL